MMEKPKRFLIFHDSIHSESVQEICSKIDEIKGELTLFLCSEGGDMMYADVLCRKLNQYKESLDIVLMYYLDSSAFDIILKCENKISLGPIFTYSIVHLPDIELPINRRGKTEKAIIKDMPRLEELELNKMKALLTKREMAVYQEGKDVILSRDRVAHAIQMNLWKIN